MRPAISRTVFADLPCRSWCPSSRVDLYEDLRAELIGMVSMIGECFLLSSRIEPFGSSATGLHEPESDIDLLLHFTTTDDVKPGPCMVKAVMCAFDRQLQRPDHLRILKVEVQEGKHTMRFDFKGANQTCMVLVDLSFRPPQGPRHTTKKNVVLV